MSKALYESEVNFRAIAEAIAAAIFIYQDTQLLYVNLEFCTTEPRVSPPSINTIFGRLASHED